MKPKPIPDGYPAVAPYLIVNGAAKAIDFYKNIFGATERMRMDKPDGRVGHAELLISGSLVMLAEECTGARGPQSIGGSPVILHLYVEDVDTVISSALAAGATATQPVETKFYGDRSGGVIDPFGHHWHISTHVEDVSPDEMQKRAAAAKKP